MLLDGLLIRYGVVVRPTLVPNWGRGQQLPFTSAMIRLSSHIYYIGGWNGDGLKTSANCKLQCITAQKHGAIVTLLAGDMLH